MTTVGFYICSIANYKTKKENNCEAEYSGKASIAQVIENENPNSYSLLEINKSLKYSLKAVNNRLN